MNAQHQTAGLFRRLGAMLYDSLIVIALLMLGTALLLPFHSGEAIPANNIYYSCYIISITIGYFLWFWVNYGQTVGMRAWRLHILTLSGEPFDYRHGMIRFGMAIPSLLLAGGGLWWMLIDPKSLSLHDRWSGTYITGDVVNHVN